MKQNRDILGDSRLKEKAYSVPEGYFDELPGRIADRCKAAAGHAPAEPSGNQTTIFFGTLANFRGIM